jgi:hypothetical protein
VNVTQAIAGGVCIINGTGAYTVTYYPNGEADIKYQYTGSLTCPPANPIPNADQPALHIRVKQMNLPECK